ncbi:N-6 DNA methylase [Methanosarcina sp. Z-7115]|uniref:site-specific DNA-methyltransferase (adenine-specific) n=1 Tax=Methanosarcina baikalica TaxID=3073890 RepID=A0ABU2D129_9EURY|nr:N-6 DNA methylase [Methanosarcina sp. Z-7115]MDR7665684.1 N-6 DNA methylase [Methanosarcina sp. Z-7115]
MERNIDQVVSQIFEIRSVFKGKISNQSIIDLTTSLFFLKCISDISEDKTKLISQTTDEIEIKLHHEEYTLIIPSSAQWHSLKRIRYNLGSALDEACRELEEKNSYLYGVLSSIDLNSIVIAASNEKDLIFSYIIQKLSEIPNLKNYSDDPEFIGKVFVELIEQTSKDLPQWDTNYEIPESVSNLIFSLLNPKAGSKFCDPVCRSGNTFIGCLKYLKQRGKDPSGIKFFGQESNLHLWRLCKMNMLLNGFADAEIKLGDLIRNPQLLSNSHLMHFDFIVSSPSFGIKNWGYEVAHYDLYNRFHYGIPPKNRGDFAYLEHMISTLNEEGKLGVVIPNGMLFRMGKEGEIRKNIIKQGIIEAVISLPPKMYPGTSVSTSILLLNKNKEERHKDSILFIGAEKDYEKGKQQNYLKEQNIEKVIEVFRNYKEIEKYSRYVSFSEIEKNEFSLNISLYINASMEIEAVDLRETLQKLKELGEISTKLDIKMDECLKELGYKI